MLPPRGRLRLFHYVIRHNRRRYATERPDVKLPKHPPLPVHTSSSSTKSETSSTTSKRSSPNYDQQAPSEAVTSDPQALSAGLREIVASFNAPVRFAMGYGSGVFKQAGRSLHDQPMLDFIFAVSHPSHWHDMNIKQHPEHYAWLPRALGSSFIGYAQDNLGAGVWFNIDCQVAGRRMKYGVVSMNSLCADLLDWRTLYLAGRLQKPTALIRDNPRVRLANQVNHASAIRTALLLLPERFTPQELFMNVAGLSYMGDPRMGLAENPDKVRNIVNGPGQLEAFRRMYSPFLPHSQLDGQLLNRNWSQDNSPVAKAELAHKLPATLREILWRQFVARGVVPSITTSSDPDAEKELWARIIQHEDFDTAIRSSLEGIVKPAAFRQSCKGALSVGPVKGVKYVWPKIQKRIWGDKK